MIETISKKTALAILKGTEGKIFSVSFRKKNGRFRVMNARLGVKKNITGKGLRFNPNRRGLLVVWDNEAQAFRMVNVKTLFKMRFGKIKYEVMA